jgi:hypothetical protein
VPGPLIFTLFARGFGGGHLTWLVVVLAGTGVAGMCGRLPGAEPRPYILRFDEAKPNPLYRRVYYTFALLGFALLNLSGLAIAAATGSWYMKQIYRYAYFPVCAERFCAGHRRRVAACGPLDHGRRPGEAVLLRLGLGGDGSADAAAGTLARTAISSIAPQTQPASPRSPGVSRPRQRSAICRQTHIRP